MAHYRACKTNHPMCDCLDCIYNMRLLQRQSYQEVQYPHVHNLMQMGNSRIMDIKLLCQAFGTEKVIKAISAMPDIQPVDYDLKNFVTTNWQDKISEMTIPDISESQADCLDVIQWHDHAQYSHMKEHLRGNRSDSEMMCLQTELLSTAYEAKAERSLWYKIKRWFKCHS